MIKVIIERKVKPEAAEEYQIEKSRLLACCGSGPGYLSGEVWTCANDPGIEVSATTWKSRRHWEDWAGSESGKTICDSLEPLLEEPARVIIYELADSPEVHWDAQLPYDACAPVV